MSKESTQIKHMMRSPKALAKFQLTGQMPKAVTPSSPLISYLDSLGPHRRVQITNVRLSPALGYQSNALFSNAQMMLNYLKPSAYMVGTWPANSVMIKSFNTKITDELFFSVQAK